VISIRILEKGHERLDYELGIQGWYPSVLNSLCANFTSVLLNVRVEDLGLEVNFRSFEGVIVAEVDVHNKLATLIGSVLRANNGRVPVSEGVTNKGDRDAFNWLVVIQVSQLLYNHSWLSLVLMIPC
jgi:hypothetical protein